MSGDSVAAAAETRLLVSVRDVGEALAAAAEGADFIDLKEPNTGALGAVPHATVRAVVTALRRAGYEQTVSATIGDWAMSEADAIVAQVQAVGACGVDLVKVGITREAAALRVLQRLANSRQRVVPVLLADDGVDMDLLAAVCELPFPAVMLDTQHKARGCLFDAVGEYTLQRFKRQVQRHGKLAGLAGSLRLEHLPQLRRLRPDIAGFRGAVCEGSRCGGLVRGKVGELRGRMGVG
jgi:uncharacterized protein (UPF0264 family)